MIAVDTNVLVYAHRSDAPFFAEARRCLTALAEGRETRIRREARLEQAETECNGVAERIAERLGWPAVTLLALGGLLYTLGMVAFATKRPRLWPHVFSYHEVFHVLVVGGSAAHYTMTLAYIAPFHAF